MADTLRQIHGVNVLECDPLGPLMRGGDATDRIGAAWSGEASLVAIPLTRLDQGFLTLSTGIAGDIIQKFVNYGLRLAIVGDVTAATAASAALRDFAYESNRGRHVWFVADRDALAERLADEA
ncbi:MAG: DUF4180 domain-containing protein [Caulobacteraceae bacterium]|nr:DUF4180 domain-containing protein [Caulobacteraceae bacterium]